MLQNFLYVGFGGFLGAGGRFLVSQILSSEANKFPLATFFVNILGCLLIGILASATEKPELKLFLITGILGGFTTFSAFSYEAILLFQAGKNLLALSYIISSCLVGVLACLLGMKLFT